MTRFLLIRHGLTEHVGHVLSGRLPGVHLNDAGRRQAEALAERLAGLPIAALYSSPLERARATAAPLARRLGQEVRIEDGLNEIDIGAWTGRRFTELHDDPLWQRFNRFRSGTRAPGGELMSEVQARMATTLERLHARHPDDYVAVVSHADPLRAVLLHYAGMPLDFFLRLEISPTSVSVLDLHDHGAVILRLNDSGALS